MIELGIIITLLGVIALLVTESLRLRRQNYILMIINRNLRQTLEKKSWGSKKVGQ